MTPSEANAARVSAGAAYQAAAAALRAAYVELAALDRVCANAAMQPGGKAASARTFADLPALPSHPEFAVANPHPGDEIRARADELLSA